MVINGYNLPSIGFMRAKALADGRYMLTVHPPGAGPLVGAEPATMIELEIDADELSRIIRQVPHLIGSRRRHCEALALRDQHSC